MKLQLMLPSAAALLSLIATVEAARHSHGHHHRVHTPAEAKRQLAKKGGQCQFPTDAGLVAITPNMQNAGWAMSPDQPCLPGHYCPYACPPGQVSMQWDPEATSYSYPMSMNGGLYCDESGEIQKPFPDRPYCQDGTGAVGVVNKCSSHVSFCQTVLPGNEAMLIPTLVQDLATLAVPDINYWCETAAHFYINPPGFDAETACVWGTNAEPYGNWSPYVAGTNADKDGNTFLKIGWNPIYLEPTTPFRDVVPDFGVEIECEGDGCNGLPCKIDPEVNGVNEITGASTDGAGGGAFCVVTVPKGEKANIVVFEKSGSGGSSPSPTSSAASSTSTSASSSKTSSSSTSTSSTVAPSSTSSSSSSSSASSSSKSSSSTNPSSSGEATPSIRRSKSAHSPSYTYAPHVFVETGSAEISSPTADAASPAAAEQTSKEGSASSSATVSILSLIISAFTAGMALLL